ncbi:hypothetical protein I4641_04485 [Waterburya agarophytonicola K14]|uniref:Uncharacterized protein n=1 Tax=Waterburya agarophytonicola KI4 TaxID=2874699 RepID=A0A964FG77_9CYAN|nr:hypothetical protein [Waterburya agarophytonicola]MCC0176233.1 hypothetical protein [Waterburya agarophytonicola KI4]
MTELTQDLSLAQAKSLIDSYAFDLGGDDAEQLLESWSKIYHASWIGLATIEALYLGRYKAISIEHILSVWLRIGNPNTHFTYEFERLICRKLPKQQIDLSEFNITTKTPTINPYPYSNYSKTQNPVAIVSERSTATLNPTKPKQFPRNIPIISALELSYQTNWSEFAQQHKIIPQFIPVPDVSSFFYKLKTFGEEKLEN